MADPVTLHELAVILITAMGGREGIGYLVKKRNGTKNGYVTKEFCGERHSHIEKLLDEVRLDVKKILSNQRPK
jgi:hypothetical protein